MDQVALDDGINFIAPLLRYLPGIDAPSIPSTDPIRQDDAMPGEILPVLGFCPPGYQDFCCPEEGKPSELPPYTPKNPPKWPKKPYPRVKPSQYQDYQDCAPRKLPKIYQYIWSIHFLMVFHSCFLAGQS